MSPRFALWILLLSMLSPPVHAGQGGNGGDVLTCTQGPFTIRLLDHFELGDRGLTLALGAPDLSVREKVKIMVERLRRFAPVRAAAYALDTDALVSDIELYKAGQGAQAKVTSFKDQELIDIPDSGQAGFPVGCKPEQLVVQREPNFPSEKFYTINTRLFDLLGNDDIALMVFHEVAYKEFQHLNSIYVRYFNGFMASAQFDAYRLPDYVNLMNLTKYEAFEFRGLRLKAASAIFYENASVKSAGVFDGNTFQTSVGTLEFTSGKVSFYDTGALAAVSGAGMVELKLQGEQCQGRPLTFQPDGQLARAELGYSSCKLHLGESRVNVAYQTIFLSNGSLIATLDLDGLRVLHNGDGSAVRKIKDLDGMIGHPEAPAYDFLILDHPKLQGRPAFSFTRNANENESFLYPAFPECKGETGCLSRLANSICHGLGLGEAGLWDSKNLNGFDAYLIDQEGKPRTASISKGGHAEAFSDIICIGASWFGPR